MSLYGEIIPSFSEGIIDRTGAQTMLYLTCTMISSVGLAHYGVSLLKTGYLWIMVQFSYISQLNNLIISRMMMEMISDVFLLIASDL